MRCRPLLRDGDEARRPDISRCLRSGGRLARSRSALRAPQRADARARLTACKPSLEPGEPLADVGRLDALARGQGDRMADALRALPRHRARALPRASRGRAWAAGDRATSGVDGLPLPQARREPPRGVHLLRRGDLPLARADGKPVAQAARRAPLPPARPAARPARRRAQVGTPRRAPDSAATRSPCATRAAARAGAFESADVGGVAAAGREVRGLRRQAAPW